jgi:hypothetical protein
MCVCVCVCVNYRTFECYVGGGGGGLIKKFLTVLIKTKKLYVLKNLIFS